MASTLAALAFSMATLRRALLALWNQPGSAAVRLSSAQRRTRSSASCLTRLSASFLPRSAAWRLAISSVECAHATRWAGTPAARAASSAEASSATSSCASTESVEASATDVAACSMATSSGTSSAEATPMAAASASSADAMAMASEILRCTPLRCASERLGRSSRASYSRRAARASPRRKAIFAAEIA